MPFHKTSNEKFIFDVRLSFEHLIQWLGESTTYLAESESLGRSLLDLQQEFMVLQQEKDVLSALRASPAQERLWRDVLLVLYGGQAMQNSSASIMLPFVKSILYAEPSFGEIVENQLFDEEMERFDGLDFTKMDTLMVFYAYTYILEQLYQMPTKVQTTPMIQSRGPDGAMRYYRTEMDFTFAGIETPNGIPELSAETRAQILQNLDSLEVLQKLLPPSNFCFTGFVVIRLVDLGNHEVSSRLRKELTRNNALGDPQIFSQIQSYLRVILNKPAAKIVLIGMHHEHIFEMHPDDPSCGTRIIQRSTRAEYAGSEAFAAAIDGRPRFFGDISDYDPADVVMQQFRMGGFRSIGIIPLRIGADTSGLLLLSHSEPNQLSTVDLINIGHLLPDLTLSIARGINDFEVGVQNLIQQEYTAIHPSVEWKFRNVAINHLMSGAQTGELAAQAINFDTVWPLYAVSDIRSSSHFRNDAIQADLILQLELARKVVQAARAGSPLPFLDELEFRIGRHVEQLGKGITSGDEVELLGFLSGEIADSLDGIEKLFSNPEIAPALKIYRAAIHPELKTVYDKRKDFDGSVSRINRAISAYLDRVQPEAQAMFPHYFDKNSTDGVDMNMYIGPEISPSKIWMPLYLRNLRIWQLIVMARIARLAWRLKPELPLELSVTHLVVIQDLPISISYNLDEKRFAVDGAYNIRYEIMKKRIDKAVVKGTGERLTQVEKIALVYSQQSERVEYERYIEFLVSQGLLEPGIDHVEIEDLQGISGLKALRVAVRMDEGQPEKDDQAIIEMIRKEFGQN